MKKSLSQTFIFLMFISNVYCQYETEWIKTIGGNFDEIPSEIIISSDSNLLLVGYTESTDGIFDNNHGRKDGILIKMNYDGEVIWNKTFGGDLTDSIPGTGLDYCNSIVQLENLDLVIGGGTNSINGDITNSIYNGFDFWFLQTNELGAKEFDTNLGGSAGEIAKKILRTNNSDEIVLFGTSRSTDGLASEQIGDSDYWGLRINTEGEVIWNTTFGTTQRDYIFDAKTTLDGGSIVVGATSQPNDWQITDCYVAKLDINGEVEWQIDFGGDLIDKANSVVELENDGYLIVGETLIATPNSPTSTQQADGWIIKLDSQGNIEWDKKIGGNKGEIISDVKLLNNQIYVIGSTFSDEGQIQQLHGSWDLWMGIFDLDGELISYSVYGGSGIELSYQILLLEDESILLVGTSNSNDFDVPANQGDKDILLIKLKKITSASIEIEQETNEVVLFPNPANEFINIEIPSDYLEGDLMIYNTLGRLVFSKTINSVVERVDVINFPEEIYYIEVLNKKKSKKDYEKILIKTNR